MLSIPRALSLRATEEGLRLVQCPIAELARLRGETQTWTDQLLRPGENLLERVRGRTLEIAADVELCQATAVGFDLRVGDGQFTRIRYDRARSCVALDRR